MGKFIKGIERNQLVLFKESIDDMIDAENAVRVIDEFVNYLDLNELEIKKVK